VGAITLKIGAGKAGMAFWPAFVNGILCNWLVCLAVWIAFGSKTTFGKLIGLWTPIWVFVASGFEHSVANMYYVPAAIFAKLGLGSGAEAAAGYASLSGLAPEVIDNLTWGSFFVNNLIPVTLGNIVGGGLFVALIYWIVYRKKA